MHYRQMKRVLEFADEDLELVEQACNELADRARREAELARGTPVERVHNYAERRFLGIAKRLKVAQG